MTTNKTAGIQIHYKSVLNDPGTLISDFGVFCLNVGNTKHLNFSQLTGCDMFVPYFVCFVNFCHLSDFVHSLIHYKCARLGGNEYSVAVIT